MLPQERRIKELQDEVSKWDKNYNNLKISHSDALQIKQNLETQLNIEVKQYHDCLDKNQHLQEEIIHLKEQVVEKTKRMNVMESQQSTFDKREHEIQNDRDAANAALNKLKEALNIVIAEKESALRQLEEARNVS